MFHFRAPAARQIKAGREIIAFRAFAREKETRKISAPLLFPFPSGYYSIILKMGRALPERAARYNRAKCDRGKSRDLGETTAGKQGEDRLIIASYSRTLSPCASNPLTSATVDFLAGFPTNERYVPTCAIAHGHRFHRNSDV